MTGKPPPTMPQNTPPMESQQQTPAVDVEAAPPVGAPLPGGSAPPTGPAGLLPQQQGYMPQPDYIPPGGYPAPQVIPAVPGQVYPQAVIGMKVLPPRPNPLPGQILIGWEVVRPEKGCCKFEGLSNNAWLIVILVAIIFWPLCWIPCVMDECYDTCQRPVYGYPQGSGPPPPQMGVPVPPPQAAAPVADAAAKV